MSRRLALWLLASVGLHAVLVALVLVLIGLAAQPLPLLFVDLVHGFLSGAESGAAGGDGTPTGAEPGTPSARSATAPTPARSAPDRAGPGSTASRPASDRTRSAPVPARERQAEPTPAPDAPRQSEPVRQAESRRAPELPAPESTAQPPHAAPPAPTPGPQPAPPVRLVEPAPSHGAGDGATQAGSGGAGASSRGGVSAGVRGGGATASSDGAAGTARGTTGDGAGRGLGARDGGMLVLAIPGEGTGAGGGEYDAYVALLRRRVQEALAYPATARRRDLGGIVHVEVEVQPSGAISRVALATSSSHAVLDEAALAAARAVERVPFPPGVTPRALRVRLPVAFDLRRQP